MPPLAALAFAMTAACGERAQSTAGFVVDTLPSGVVRVTSLQSRDSATWRLRTGLDTALLFSRRGVIRVAVLAEEKSAWIDERVTRDRKFVPEPVPEPVLRASLRADDTPNQRPWFDRLWVDALGRRWVALGRRSGAPMMLDVFDTTSRWLDVVTVAATDWPDDPWAPIAFGSDRVAVVLTSDEGAPIVRVMGIVPTTPRASVH